jgi:hypothetical protein
MHKDSQNEKSHKFRCVSVTEIQSSYSIYFGHCPFRILHDTRTIQNLLWENVSMVVRVWQLIQERPWLQNKCRKHYFGEVHAWPHLLHKVPDEGLVFLRKFFHLLPCLYRTPVFTIQEQNMSLATTTNGLFKTHCHICSHCSEVYTRPQQIFYRPKKCFKN